MAQTDDWSPDNAVGSVVRAAMIEIFAAIQSSSSGSTAPSPTVGGMLWLDTGVSPPVLRMRNAANTGWIDVVPEAFGANRIWGNLSGSSAPPAAVTIADLITALGFSQVTGAPRRLSFPGGMRIQGGVATTGAAGQALTFPLAFNASPTFLVSPLTIGGGAFVTWNTLSPTGVNLIGWTSNSINANLTCHWLAFGE